MRKLTCILTTAFLVVMLVACGKDGNTDNSEKNGKDSVVTEAPVTTDVPETTATPTVTDSEGSGSGTDTQNTDITPAVNEPIVTEAPATTPEPTPTEATLPTETPTPVITEVPTTQELKAAYTYVLNELAKESEFVEDLVFTTVDVNNDGVRELLYAESSVFAAGVNICFYDNGKIVAVEPFGCYGGVKYAPEEGKIISGYNYDENVHYEITEIADEYYARTVDVFEVNDSSEDGSLIYIYNGVEKTHDEFINDFKAYNDVKIRSVDYYDMYWYTWCNDEFDPLDERIEMMLTGDEDGRDSHLIIPADEKAKLVGSWNLYSHEIEGEVYYADESDISGKVIIDDNYKVTIYNDDNSVWHEDMDMYFETGSYNAYTDNTDWYVNLSGDNLGGDEFYMNVTQDDQLFINYINTENEEYYISTWDYYNRAVD